MDELITHLFNKPRFLVEGVYSPTFLIFELLRKLSSTFIFSVFRGQSLHHSNRGFCTGRMPLRVHTLFYNHLLCRWYIRALIFFPSFKFWKADWNQNSTPVILSKLVFTIASNCLEILSLSYLFISRMDTSHLTIPSAENLLPAVMLSFFSPWSLVISHFFSKLYLNVALLWGVFCIVFIT